MSLDDLEKQKKKFQESILRLAREQKEERVKFILTLSSKERGLLRDILGALKDEGFFRESDFDPKTVDLSKIFFPPHYPLYSHGLRLCGVTEGPGLHKPQGRHVVGGVEYQVKPGEVYITLDDIGFLVGRSATYRFIRTTKGLELEEIKTHALSFR